MHYWAPRTMEVLGRYFHFHCCHPYTLSNQIPAIQESNTRHVRLCSHNMTVS